MCAKACSGRPSTVKGLDTIPRFIGGVVGDDVVAPLVALLLITVATVRKAKHEILVISCKSHYFLEIVNKLKNMFSLLAGQNSFY